MTNYLNDIVNEIPSKTLAAILADQNQPLKLEEIDLPSQLFAGQVLVRVHVSGICGSQLGEISGAKGADPYLPHLMGHEGCATVIKVGPGVQTIKPGDLVVLHWRKGSGIQSAAPKYRLNGEVINAGWVTTFNSYAVVSENRCTSIPMDTPKDVAALFGCAITTGFGVVENNAKLKMGESILVFGAGGIGLNIIQAASLVNAYPIIAVDLVDERLTLASSMGATHIINNLQCDIKNSLLEIIGDSKLDVFIDNTGIPNIIEFGYENTNDNGRIILVGVPRVGNNINIFSLPLHFGKILIGSHGGESRPERDIPRYLNLFNNDRIKFDKLVSDRFPLKKINEAIELMKNGNSSGRILIDI